MSKTARLSGIVCCLAAVMAVSASPSASKQPARKAPVRTGSVRYLATAARAQAMEVNYLRSNIDQLRRSTWHWQNVAGVRQTRTAYIERRTTGVGLLRWTSHLWRRRKMAAEYHARHPPHLDFWLCVHGGEASWTDDASHNPHYGGYQLSWWFMVHYASRLLARVGTANKWPALVQTWVVENAFKREHYSRNWLSGQWPATSPPCLDKLGSGA